MSIAKVLSIGALLLLLTGLGFQDVGAHGGATGIVKERMESMKVLAESMKNLAAMIKGKVAYEPEKASTIAQKMKEHGGDKLTQMFPEGSLKMPTEALPEIWQDWDRFSGLARSLAETAEAFSVAATSNTEPTMKEFKNLAATCAGCHKTFRKKK